MITNVIQYLEQTAKKYPGKIAFRDKEQAVTFKDLVKEAKKVARNLFHLYPDRRNAPVAVLLPKSVSAIVAFFGILYSGNYYVPLDPRLPDERLHTILSILNPICTITNAGFSSKLKTDWVDIENLPHDRYEDDQLAFLLKKQIDTNPVYVLFTSGSTGTPKGVVISHRSVIDYCEWLSDFFQFDESTIFGNQAPFHFDNSVLDIYSTIKNGCEMVIMPEEFFMFPKKLAGYMEKQNINTIFWVPSAMTLFSKTRNVFENCRVSLRKILFCGEVMPVTTLNFWKQHFPDALYANLYGPTEITDVCCCYIVDREFAEDDVLPIGFACKNTEIMLLNETNQPITRPHEEGEICVKGSSLFLGYYKNENQTRNALVQNPINHVYEEKIYRTGDIAKYNEQGELVYVARKDFQIKHLGYRIELGDIEGALSTMDAVKEVCSVYDAAQDAIFVFCSIREKTTEKEIYEWLCKKLPHYMLPVKIEILNDIPHTSNGKIDRTALKSSLKTQGGKG